MAKGSTSERSTSAGSLSPTPPARCVVRAPRLLKGDELGCVAPHPCCSTGSIPATQTQLLFIRAGGLLGKWSRRRAHSCYGRGSGGGGGGGSGRRQRIGPGGRAE